MPTGWGFAITGQVHSINIPLSANPNIFGEPLAANDWIGVFYLDDDGEEACGGAVQWDGISNVAVNAYGDDPFSPEKDGFGAGEQFRWRLFDCSAMEGYSACVTYNPTMPCQGSFGDFCLSELLSIQAAMYHRYFSLATGWNSMSSDIVPCDPNAENMFAANVEKLIILRNLTSLYWPSAGVNTIGDWDNSTGYAVKLYEGFDMEINGDELASNELALSAGWHYLPVLTSCKVSADDLFGASIDDITIVQDLIGTHVWWPDVNVFTLDSLEPGKAYKIRVTNEIVLMFPECDAKASTGNFKHVNTISSPMGSLNMTPETHLVSIMVGSFAEIEKGDYFGAFNQANKLCGFVEIQSTGHNQVMVLFGDDAYTDISDGFVPNEMISYRLYRPSTKETFDLKVEYEPTLDNSGVFNINSMSAITGVTLTGLDTPSGLEGSGISIFPNPSSGIFNIEGIADKAGISIFNAFGDEIRDGTFILPDKIDLSQQPKGIYFIRITTEKGMYFEKLLIN